MQVNQLKSMNLNLWWRVTEAQSPVCAIADSLALYRNNIYGYIGQAGLESYQPGFIRHRCTHWLISPSGVSRSKQTHPPSVVSTDEVDPRRGLYVDSYKVTFFCFSFFCFPTTVLFPPNWRLPRAVRKHYSHVFTQPKSSRRSPPPFPPPSLSLPPPSTYKNYQRGAGREWQSVLGRK